MNRRAACGVRRAVCERRSAGGGRQLFVAITLFVLASEPVRAQADSTRSIPLFTYRDAALAGVFSLSALLIRPLDEHYAARLQDSSTQANRKLHRISRFVRTVTDPGSVIIGTTMYVTGRVTKHERMAELGLHGTEALLLGELVGIGMKGFIGRQRPYVEPRNSHSFEFMRGFESDQYRSFPSGHTLAAFAAAAAVTSETSGWWPDTRWVIGPVLYGGATLTAMSRMYDNRHWASDVIIGAGLGTFAGLKVVRYSRGHQGNRLDRWFLTGSLVPTDDGYVLRWSLIPDLGARRGSPP